MLRKLNICQCKLVREKRIEYETNLNVKAVEDVINVSKELGFAEYSEEHFGFFSVDVKGSLVDYCEVSHGELSKSSVHPREIFKRAILCNAAAIILIHNHPSGKAEISDEDRKATQRVARCGELMGIPVLDHIIIGDCEFVSLKREGLIT